MTLLDAELILRITLAALIGSVLGLEREAAGHEPGIRTHALVAVGATVFTIAGAYGFEDIDTGRSADPARVAAQVAAGIGFIGAGAVLRSGATVRGLTTASTLWVSAAVGVAAGAGIYLPLVSAVVVTLLVLIGLHKLKPPLLRRLGGVHRRLRVEYQRGYGTIGPLVRQLEEGRCRVGRLHVEDDNGDGRLHLDGIRRVTVSVQAPDLVIAQGGHASDTPTGEAGEPWRVFVNDPEGRARAKPWTSVHHPGAALIDASENDGHGSTPTYPEALGRGSTPPGVSQACSRRR